MTQLRIIFMGTPEFAIPTLSALIKSPHEVVAVYSQPPRPVGRGHKVQLSPVHRLAEQHDIPVLTPTSLRAREEQEIFQGFNADLAVIVSYGLLLPKAILDAPRLGCVNIHVSLLPRWRGAAPIQHAILAGDTETGITIMKMGEGLDTGPTLCQQKIAITPETTTSQLFTDMAQVGAKLLLEILVPYAQGRITPTPQPANNITHAPKITKDMGYIDWNDSAEHIDCKIRALNPWPGTWFEWQGRHIKVLQAKVLSAQHGLPGEVLDQALTVACGQGALALQKIQVAGKKPMNPGDFFNGYPVQVGTRFIK